MFVLVVTVLIALFFFLRPAHTYDVKANEKIWLRDVHTALGESGAGGTVPPVGPLHTIKGVGKIKEVFVSKATLRKAVMVEFLTGIDQKYAGLVYLDGYPPPPDSCNVHLGGPWWQIATSDGTSCPRGYSFTGGG